jgi:tellurite methyltransferase
LGCGEGGNALLLARKGFDVVAIDILKPSITKLKGHAAAEGLKIEAITGDIETYLNVCKEFDVIFGINILQFINSKKISTVIKSIKQKTAPG